MTAQLLLQLCRVSSFCVAYSALAVVRMYLNNQQAAFVAAHKAVRKSLAVDNSAVRTAVDTVVHTVENIAAVD